MRHRRQPQVQPQGSISRAEFIQYIQARYNTQEVRTGTQQEQEAQLTRNFGGQTVQPTVNGWQSWDPAVQTALRQNQTPDSQYIITPDTWNHPHWIEQPMSHYMVAGGPGEDFAETTAAYIYHPALLQQRSPRRFQFFQTHLLSWVRGLQALPEMHPMGDFNLPRGNTRVA